MRCALLALLLATSPAGAADLRSARTVFDDGGWEREAGQLGQRTTTPAIRYTRGDLAAGTFEQATVAEGPESRSLCLGAIEAHRADPTAETAVRSRGPEGSVGPWREESARASLPPRRFRDLIGREALLIEAAAPIRAEGRVFVLASFLVCRKGRELAGTGAAPTADAAWALARRALGEAVRLQDRR